MRQVIRGIRSSLFMAPKKINVKTILSKKSAWRPQLHARHLSNNTRLSYLAAGLMTGAAVVATVVSANAEQSEEGNKIYRFEDDKIRFEGIVHENGMAFTTGKLLTGKDRSISFTKVTHHSGWGKLFLKMDVEDFSQVDKVFSGFETCTSLSVNYSSTQPGKLEMEVVVYVAGNPSVENEVDFAQRNLKLLHELLQDLPITSQLMANPPEDLEILKRAEGWGISKRMVAYLLSKLKSQEDSIKYCQKRILDLDETLLKGFSKYDSPEFITKATANLIAERKTWTDGIAKNLAKNEDIKNKLQRLQANLPKFEASFKQMILHTEIRIEKLMHYNNSHDTYATRNKMPTLSQDNFESLAVDLANKLQLPKEVGDLLANCDTAPLQECREAMQDKPHTFKIK